MNRFKLLPSSLLLTLATSVLAASANRLHADDIYWNGATGAFDSGANWLNGVAPSGSDTAIIDNGGTAQIGVGVDVLVQEIRTDFGNIEQTGGSLTATFIPTGPGDNTLRGINIGAASGGISEYTASGNAQISGTAVRIGILGGEGTVSLSDDASYTSFDGYDTWLGQGAGSIGTLNLSDRASWNIVGNALVVGRQGGTGNLHMSGDSRITGNANQIYFGDNGGTTATITMTDRAEVAWQNGDGVIGLGRGGATATMTMTGDSKVRAGGEFWVGNNGGSTGTLILSEQAEVSANNWIVIGRDGATGIVDMSGTSRMVKTGGGDFSIADQANATGTLTVRENAVIDVQQGRLWVAHGDNSTGTLTVADNAQIIAGGEVLVGNGIGSTGTINLNGGSITANGWVAIGRDGPGTGVLNVSGGTFTKNGDGNFIMNGGPQSLVNQTGGAILVNSGQTWLSEFGDRVSNWQASGGTANLGAATLIGRDGTGTMTISGTADYTNGVVTLGANNVNAKGTLNLNGGTFAASSITKGSGTGTLNLNGGVVKATADSLGYFGTLGDSDIHVQAGGLKFNTNGHSVIITQSLAGVGGLTKQGDGALEIASATSFAGASFVQGGSLVVSGSLGGAESLSLATGTSLALGSNVSLNDAIVLSLASGSAVELNFAGAETIASLWLNGVGIEVGTYTVEELNALGGGVTFTGLDGTSALTVTTAVPEPSTVALLVAAGFSACLMARRRKV